MIRRLFTILSAASLVLCVAACVLWAWSYAQLTSVSWADAARTRSYAVVCSRGGVAVVVGRARPEQLVPEPGGTSAVNLTDPFDVGDAWRQGQYGPAWGGFGVGRQRDSAVDYRLAMVPLWLVAATALLPPAAWAARRHRRSRIERRLAAGQCVACGYDLRATPEQGKALLGRCPDRV